MNEERRRILAILGVRDTLRVTSPWRAAGDSESVPALAAGAALVTSGTDLPREGVLAFYQDRIAVFFDDGGERFDDYADLESFKLRPMRWPPFSPGGLKKLTMEPRYGSRVHCGIGPEMAANAEYVLSAKGVKRK